jgi:hypothetical protein
MAAPPALIDEAAQRAEKLRHAVDFIQDDKLVLVLAQKEGGVSEFTPIFARLQVEVERRNFFGQLESQRCFANLTGADQRHCGLSG